jgi:hypothetical protein
VAAGDDDVSVLVCPLCAAAVRLSPGEDANTVWAAHAGDSAACDPAAYAQRVHKPRCPVGGCREKLTFSNRVACRACGRATCLRHRFPDDHGCKQANAAAAATRAAAARAAAARAAAARAAAQPAQGWRAAPPALPRRPTQADKRAAAAAQFANPTNSLRGTAARRAQGPGGPEACPTCGARFADVAALIAHAEAAHGGGGGDARLREACPACGARFADAVALVAHHNAAHGGRGATADASCALS